MNQPPELVAELLNQGVVSIAQLHGQETEEYLTTLRSLTVQPIWQAFQVKTGEELREGDEVYVTAIQGESANGSLRHNL